MSITINHHFVPVFYLKQFTNDNGSFFIYDVVRKQFKRGGNFFFPNSHFYEKHGNTIFNGSNSSDFVEKSYGKWDQKVAEVYRKVINSTETQLTDQEWVLMQYFVNILFWRNPKNADKVKEYIAKSTKLSDFVLKPTGVGKEFPISNAEELILFNKMKENPELPKFLKSMIPAITFSEIFEKKQGDFAHILTSPAGLPKLASDYPIIYRNISNESLHTDDFIFPLSDKKILFRNKLTGIAIHAGLRIFIDMLLLLQARKYVACTDLKYPNMLLEIFERKFSSIQQLREFIFSNVYEKKLG